LIADVVVPTPGLVVVAWIALVLGITWLIMFAVVFSKEFKENKATDGYKLVCMACLFGFILFSLITNIGLVING